MTLRTVVPEAARRFGDRPAYVADAGWSMSYQQLDDLSDEVAVALATDIGIGPGDVVALTLPSTIEYVVLYAALAKLQAVTTGVNPRYTAAERAAVLRVAEPTLVITPADLASGTDDGSAWPTLEIEIAVSTDALLADLRAGHHGQVPPAAEEDDAEYLIAIVFTSGTTGTPKGAMFGVSEIDAISRTDLGERADGWGGGGPMLASTQFAHVGFMTKLPEYLRLGMTTYLRDRWRAADVLRLVHDTKMTSVGGVAPQMALMLADPDFDAYDFSAVTTIVMGGALSPPDLVREARERFGAAYSIRYSSTESGGVGTATAFDADDEEALYTVGRPRPGVELELRDEDDRAVAQGEVGEICLRSRCMLRGYWNDPEATAATLRGGWLHSGDLGRIDDDGRLRMAGRAKEMFIRGGYNVYPQEVEAVLAAHPAVRQVVVVPRPDRLMGEIGVAVVVPVDPDRAPTVEDLRSHGRATLSSYKLPEAVRIVGEIPLTAMQKVDRRALAAAELPLDDPTGADA